ncbi:prepilin-type N-terminal cleavage/methylation domain-containing protein [Pelomonas aquatica]|jgi:MSHA pilin protein MshD|uniref:Type II secretion system protein n=1 Tax=Pelomonas aquatica TaxID=431058 RepID=A0A9X4LPD4_9BURK|nr:prepilin-type N-terminal cleavage/methylation domain-containing protein [Pelomonas aquatica]MCY4756914.1 prepilin-type N-terminal cleavage/methylation domain-containing protein [Pelomonas aquatica]MDG0864685.1 type II secretion system protein [Pelomonas aquatica]
MPALHPGPRSRGLTLIELLLFVVVVGIALGALLGVFATATKSSADPMIRRQQLAIAESLLREVELMPFTWCDPSDANVETATSAAGCASLPEGMGPEAGQTRYTTPYFNNVNDYAGFAMNSGILDNTGTAIAGLGGYKASVDVSAVALDNVAAGDALKITVTVTAPDNSTISLQGWRTRYAPNAPD